MGGQEFSVQPSDPSVPDGWTLVSVTSPDLLHSRSWPLATLPVMAYAWKRPHQSERVALCIPRGYHMAWLRVFNSVLRMTPANRPEDLRGLTLRRLDAAVRHLGPEGARLLALADPLALPAFCDALNTRSPGNTIP